MTRDEELDEEFDKIAQKAIAVASGVKCSLEDFRTGLMTMRLAMDERIQQVTEELGE